MGYTSNCELLNIRLISLCQDFPFFYIVGLFLDYKLSILHSSHPLTARPIRNAWTMDVSEPKLVVQKSSMKNHRTYDSVWFQNFKILELSSEHWSPGWTWMLVDGRNKFLTDRIIGMNMLHWSNCSFAYFN